jgi:hypothetical protein
LRHWSLFFKQDMAGALTRVVGGNEI